MTELVTSTSTWISAAAWLAKMSVAAGLVLVVAVLADMLLARRVAARWRSLLYLAVFVRIALPVEWASPVGLLRAQDVAMHDVRLVEPAASSLPAMRGRPAVEPLPARGSVPLPLMAWSLGTLLLAGGALIARARLARAVLSARPAGPRVGGLQPGTPVLEHDRLGPAAFGILAPRIVVPSPLLDRLDDEALRGVIRHEVAHVRRRDPLRLALLQGATALAWPILPAWLAAWRLRGLMEQACDEEALRGANALGRRSFGEALLAVADWQPVRSRFAVAMLPFGGGLRARLGALRFTRRWPAGVQLAVVTVAALVPVLVLGARDRARETAPPGAAAQVSLMTADAIPLATVPPIVRLKFEMFDMVTAPTDGPAMAQLDFVPPSEGLSGRVIAAEEMARLRGILTASSGPVGEHVYKSWLGGRGVTQVNFKTQGQPDTTGARLVLLFGPSIQDDAFVLRLGVLAGENPQSDVEIKLHEGEGIHLSALPNRQRGAVHVLLTPENVRFDAETPRIESTRVTLSLTDVPVADAVNALGQAIGLPLPLDGTPSTEPVSLSVGDLPGEDAVMLLARSLDLSPVSKGGMVRLASGGEPPPATNIMLSTSVWSLTREQARSLPVVERVVPRRGGSGHASIPLNLDLLDQLEVDLSSMEKLGDAELVSRPMIMVTAGERAEIESGPTDGSSKLTLSFTSTVKDSVVHVDMATSWTDGDITTSGAAGMALPGAFVIAPPRGNVLVYLVGATLQER